MERLLTSYEDCLSAAYDFPDSFEIRVRFRSEDGLVGQNAVGGRSHLRAKLTVAYR